MDDVIDRPLTRSQEARRQRVIDAAMALALEGGYDAVQMRDVATKADVAMGTVYRYFNSKDHLLAASLVYWVEQLEHRLAQQPTPGSTPAERVLGVLDRALRSMNRQPKLVAAVFTSLSSPDPAAVECQLRITQVMDSIVTTAIGHVWYSAMVGWVNGWATIDRVHHELQIAVDLLLPASLSA